MDTAQKNPIHSPCPDMAGLTDFDAALTQKRLAGVRALRESLGLNTGRTFKGGQDMRYSRRFQAEARRTAILRRAALINGGAL
ncbi:hypothetical protein [Photobacterium salinisoli]|uniref:hypothetical protein n=1 Tax=Photobacterium salinisoli TaxID=1616783 RepID=UPI000EA0F492|nr:hypothetical protein [Photobacterium salinisoli]